MSLMPASEYLVLIAVLRIGKWEVKTVGYFGKLVSIVSFKSEQDPNTESVVPMLISKPNWRDISNVKIMAVFHYDS